MKKVNPELDPNKEAKNNRPATSNDLQKIEEKIFEHMEADNLISNFEQARFSLNMTDNRLNNVFENVESKCFDAHK